MCLKIEHTLLLQNATYLVISARNVTQNATALLQNATLKTEAQKIA
jgi:hypothetical protein